MSVSPEVQPLSRNASWLRRSVRTCETLVQPCRRKMVYSCRWRPHTLQRFAIQRCRVIHENYHSVHADLLWNLLGYRYSGQEQTRWGLAPFVGVGLIHNSSNKTSPFAFSYGIQGQYRISKRVSAVLEFSGTTTSQKFDGYGRTNRLGDHMVSLTAGFTFHLGK